MVTNNLPQIGDTAADNGGAVWTVREIQRTGEHSRNGARGLHGGYITKKVNYYALLVLINQFGATTVQPLTAWRNLCKTGEFVLPTCKSSRCKGFEVPAYQRALQSAWDAGIETAEERIAYAEAVSGVDRDATYSGPARVGGQCVEGKYEKL